MITLRLKDKTKFQEIGNSFSAFWVSKYAEVFEVEKNHIFQKAVKKVH